MGAGKGQRSKRGADLDNAGLLAGYNASTRGVLVVHDEGTVVQLCDAGVELAQQLEHARLVGLSLLLVESARQIMRVELVARRVRLANLVVEGLQSLVIVNRGNAGSELAVDELVLPQRAGKEVE